MRVLLFGQLYGISPNYKGYLEYQPWQGLSIGIGNSCNLQSTNNKRKSGITILSNEKICWCNQIFIVNNRLKAYNSDPT